jgi:hypothetical protein
MVLCPRGQLSQQRPADGSWTNAQEAIAKASPVLLLASCGEADEAWRSKLRSVRPSDLIDTLSEEVPADLWQSSFEWARKRAG